MFASGSRSDALPLLLKAAKRLESIDLGLARETYLNAWMAALSAGRLAAGGDLLEVCRAARALPPPAQPRILDLVLDALALIVTDGPAAAGPALRQAVHALTDADITTEDALRWGWLTQAAASALWHDDAWRALLVRQVRLAREAGAVDQLPVTLDALGMAVAASGAFAAASALIAEADAICEATGARAARLSAMMLAALRGGQAEGTSLIEAAIAAAEDGGPGIAVAYARWAAAILKADGRMAPAQDLHQTRHQLPTRPACRAAAGCVEQRARRIGCSGTVPPPSRNYPTGKTLPAAALARRAVTRTASALARIGRPNRS